MIKVTKEFATEAEAIAWLGGNATPAVTHAPAPAPLQPAAAPAPAPAHAPAPAPATYAAPTPAAAVAPAPAPAPAPSAITTKDLGVQAGVFAKKYGPKAAKEVLARYGLTQLAAATPEQYPALMAEFQQ